MRRTTAKREKQLDAVGERGTGGGRGGGSRELHLLNSGRGDKNDRATARPR